MSEIYLLKLIHDAEGEFSVDDIGSVDGLELLFELQSRELIIEEPTTKRWGLTDLGEWRVSLEDYSASELDSRGTPLQKTLADRMVNLKWRVSHLWEYENDQIAVWMIADSTDKPGGFTHACILPDGTVLRPDTTLKGALR